MSKINWLLPGLVLLTSLNPYFPVLAQNDAIPAGTAEVNSNSTAELESSSLPLAQMTRVSQLSDVQPTDWAFAALQSLIQRYGALTGYSDGRFRGDRPLTRYEFTAALNQFLIQLDQQLVTTREAQLSREDFATLRRLQVEYGSAVGELRDRMARMETLAVELADNQFSTTTKLQGQAIIAFTSGSEASSTFVSRTRLSLVTQFGPSDDRQAGTATHRLVTQLEVGNNGADAVSVAHNRGINLLGTTGLLADGGGLEYSEASNIVALRQLHYTFRPLPNLAVTVGPQMQPRDWIDRNRLANNAAESFSSSFFINNPLIVQNQVDLPGGAGAAFDWALSRTLSLRGLYVATNAADPRRGLFSSSQSQSSAELEYAPSTSLALRLQYTQAVINQTVINAGGINAEFRLNRQAALFGRYGFGTYRGFNTGLATNLDLSPQTWAVGLALQDVGIPGTRAGLAIGQPFVEGNLGNATQTNYEAFYNLLLSDNVSVTPSFLIVTGANNNSDSPTIFEGTLRTVFSF